MVAAHDRSSGSPVGFVRDPIARKLRVATWALLETFLARGPDALPQARALFARAVHA
jgi:hypothetical protein